MKPPYVWTYDPIAKAGYLKLSNGAVERTIELIEGLNLDIEEDGSVHGIEVLQAKHQPSKSDEIEEIEEDEMTPFEQNLAQAILSALEYRGFYDCGKYLDTSLIEHLRPILDAETKKAVEEVVRENSDKLWGEGYTAGILYERNRIEEIFEKHVPPHAMDLEDSVWLKRLLNKAFNHSENI